MTMRYFDIFECLKCLFLIKDLLFFSLYILLNVMQINMLCRGLNIICYFNDIARFLADFAHPSNFLKKDTIYTRYRYHLLSDFCRKVVFSIRNLSYSSRFFIAPRKSSSRYRFVSQQISLPFIDRFLLEIAFL